jgi:hypothetical protein
MPARKSSASRVTRYGNLPEQSRDHAEDNHEEHWTKLMVVVFARGAPSEAHISEIIALARAEQDEIKLRMRRTMRIYKQSQSMH